MSGDPTVARASVVHPPAGQPSLLSLVVGTDPIEIESTVAILIWIWWTTLFASVTSAWWTSSRSESVYPGSSARSTVEYPAPFQYDSVPAIDVVGSAALVPAAEKTESVYPVS